MSHSRAPRVLIMAEDWQLGLAMDIMLEREGFEVAATPSAERALELQHRLPADVLVADTLGDQGSVRAIERFRREFPGTRIVAMARGRKAPHGIAGADVTLGKPFDRDALIQAVRALAAGKPRATVP